MNNIAINLIIYLSFVGFLVSFYIYNKKHNKKKLICPMKSSCDKVVHSKYSEIMGIQLEVLGMIYYLLMLVSYNIIIIFNLHILFILILLLVISLCSVLFSIYLASLQVFILKQWCAWCLSSALITLLIFILSCVNFVLN